MSSPQGLPGKPPRPATPPVATAVGGRPAHPARPAQPAPVHHGNGRLMNAAAEVEDERARKAFELARAGERSAYGVVVRVYQNRLFNAVFRLVGNHEDAAEITQEAFTRGLEKLSEFRGDSGPYTWLFRIAMNAAVSRIRRSSRRRTLSLEAMDSPDSRSGSAHGRFADTITGHEQSPFQAAEMSEEHKAVVAALNQLDAEHRALLVMRDLEGFDYRQMAEVLGLPLGTLKSRLFRARMALRDLLEPQFKRRDARK